MRIRRLLASGVLVGGLALVVAPGVAHASTSKSELLECLEKAAQKPTTAEVNSAAEDCYKAPNPVTPAVGEILWGGAAFLIVLFVLVKFAFPALKKGMKDREEKIREDLEAAERARTEAETEATQYRAQLADARGEAGRIIEEARQAADDVRKDLIARAEADAAEVRQRAQEDARLAAERAMADLQGRVSDLSIELAERIVERNLDRDTQIALIESYINEVGSSR
jgi:F-type H+-transporting ATPase subunit b